MRKEAPMYTKLWLNYELKEGAGAFVTVSGVSPEHPVLKNAVTELSSCPALSGFSVSLCLLYDLSLKQNQIEPGCTVNPATEGYRIIISGNDAFRIEAASETGLIYGAFRLINLIRLRKIPEFPDETGSDKGLNHKNCISDSVNNVITEIPFCGLRLLNHWDNMDGSIERGYSGNSFFFEDNRLIINERTKDYARLLCSAGCNGIVINNVNVKGEALRLIDDKWLYKVNELSELFSSFGIRLYLSINYAASMEDPSVNSADPAEKAVQDFWSEKFNNIYEKAPGLGGFLVKADSEGRPGPFTYGRTQAEGANMLARALKPHNGLILWRCFVYNCKQDWRDLKTDRARAAYDYFHDLDGEFDDNVILQVKNGPMDFQVREPVSPLFGAMPRTDEMIEFQIAQEYTGQQRHVCYLIPWFKEVLDFDTYGKSPEDRGSRVANIVKGMCAVSNTGNDENWTGHDLAAANLYGFLRLSFCPKLSAQEIAGEWIKLTYGSYPVVLENVKKILMMSWPAYEKYTAPLGIGWMVTPNTHYGPDPDGYEYSLWGTYHKATCREIGVERNSTGTGYTSLYNEPLASVYEDPKTTPKELILFFHRLPYDYVLPCGKTIIQHIYDTHFEGVEDVDEMASLWKELRGLVDEEAFIRVSERLAHQKEHARQWRDVINSYFYRRTLIADDHGRTLY
ncbi:MAG: alpha-glucuronidase [Lachnospiraceae bacterium]|nr:alpha-glucuronidase [Lachnospiraceae bacterium]